MQQEEEIKYKGLFAQYNDGKEFVHNVRNIAPLFNPLDFTGLFLYGAALYNFFLLIKEYY